MKEDKPKQQPNIKERIEMVEKLKELEKTQLDSRIHVKKKK